MGLSNLEEKALIAYSGGGEVFVPIEDFGHGSVIENPNIFRSEVGKVLYEITGGFEDRATGIRILNAIKNRLWTMDVTAEIIPLYNKHQGNLTKVAEELVDEYMDTEPNREKSAERLEA